MTGATGATGAAGPAGAAGAAPLFDLVGEAARLPCISPHWGRPWGPLGWASATRIAAWAALPFGAFASMMRWNIDGLWGLDDAAVADLARFAGSSFAALAKLGLDGACGATLTDDDILTAMRDASPDDLVAVWRLYVADGYAFPPAMRFNLEQTP